MSELGGQRGRLARVAALYNDINSSSESSDQSVGKVARRRWASAAPPSGAKKSHGESGPAVASATNKAGIDNSAGGRRNR